MRTLLFAAALALAGVSGCAKDKSGAAGEKAEKAGEAPNLSIDEVEKGLADKSLVAVDCNGDKTRKKLGVLPGAILLADEEAFVASDLPADKATKLVFYCSGPG
jgi:hypothetical protein